MFAHGYTEKKLIFIIIVKGQNIEFNMSNKFENIIKFQTFCWFRSTLVHLCYDFVNVCRLLKGNEEILE